MKSLQQGQWLMEDQICVAKGHPVASNLMFETKKDHQLFLKLWDQYLGSMTEVINYHLGPKSWTMLFRTKSKSDIKKAYYELREKSKKANKQNILVDVSRILSEHFRILLSQYVRLQNLSKGRKGTLVLNRFQKYVIKDEIEYIKVFESLIEQKSKNPQNIKRYQADESGYDERNEMQKASIWKIGLPKMERTIEVPQVLQCMIWSGVDWVLGDGRYQKCIYILRNLLSTKNIIKKTTSPP